MFPAHRLLSIFLLFTAAQALAPSDATASPPGPDSPVVPYAAPACNHPQASGPVAANPSRTSPDCASNAPSASTHHTLSPIPADLRQDVDGDPIRSAGFQPASPAVMPDDADGDPIRSAGFQPASSADLPDDTDGDAIRSAGFQPASSADLRDDADGDGVPDNIDVCPNTPPGVAVDAVGRPLGDVDADCDTDLDDFALFQQGFTGPLSPLGACCDTATGECTDDVPAEDCLPPLDFTPDQLCDELDPPCIAEGYGVLYAPSHPDNPTFRAQLSAMLGEPVDYYDPRSDTPTLEELLPYRAVFTWANYAYDDLYAFSAVLLEYVEAGRTLIMGQWSYDAMYGTPTFPSPLIESEYCPVDTSYYTSAVYDGNGTDCAYTTGLVDQLSAEYFDICSPRPGMVTDGTAEGGAFPMLIWYPDRRVYYSPGNTGETVTDGDWVELTYGMVVCDD